jgi:protein phosphatase 2C
MAAAICAEDDAPLAAAERAGGGIEKPDLVDAKAGALKRSMYLMDCAPVWGSASTRGLSAEMEDACAAAPRFADVPVCLFASRRDLDGLGIDAGELRLPAHPVAVYDGHGRPEVQRFETICSIAALRLPHDLTTLLFRWLIIVGKGSTFS